MLSSTLPIDCAERLVGFRCIRLHRHQVVSVVGFDDAAGGISDCEQRVERDDMSGKRHFFEVTTQLPQRRSIRFDHQSLIQVYITTQY